MRRLSSIICNNVQLRSKFLATMRRLELRLNVPAVSGIWIGREKLSTVLAILLFVDSTFRISLNLHSITILLKDFLEQAKPTKFFFCYHGIEIAE